MICQVSFQIKNLSKSPLNLDLIQNHIKFKVTNKLFLVYNDFN